MPPARRHGGPARPAGGTNRNRSPGRPCRWGGPIGAVEAYLSARGIAFAGTCAAADPVTDAGSYCTVLYDDHQASQVHLIGPVGSEPDAWLLVEAGQYGWGVIDSAPPGDPNASPPF